MTTRAQIRKPPEAPDEGPRFSSGYVIGILFSLLLAGCRGGAARPDLHSFLENGKAAVFIFLAPDCPLSQNYTLTLNGLDAEFKGRGIRFYGVVPGNGFQQSSIDAFIQEYNITFPVIPDRNFELSDFFGAMKTPEVFVVAADGTTLYRGAIDNWAAELGQHRTVITAHYLREVLVNLANGYGIRYSETPAVGCFIERRN